MIRTELAPRVTSELNKVAVQVRDLVQQQDPLQRPHQFTRVTISPDGLDFQILPSRGAAIPASLSSTLRKITRVEMEDRHVAEAEYTGAAPGFPIWHGN